jgi:hypothetical protein
MSTAQYVCRSATGPESSHAKVSTATCNHTGTQAGGTGNKQPARYATACRQNKQHFNGVAALWLTSATAALDTGAVHSPATADP